MLFGNGPGNIKTVMKWNSAWASEKKKKVQQQITAATFAAWEYRSHNTHVHNLWLWNSISRLMKIRRRLPWSPCKLWYPSGGIQTDILQFTLLLYWMWLINESKVTHPEEAIAVQHWCCKSLRIKKLFILLQQLCLSIHWPIEVWIFSGLMIPFRWINLLIIQMLSWFSMHLDVHPQFSVLQATYI